MEKENKENEENELLVKRLFVAMVEQRVIDTRHYGANCYAPITMDIAREILEEKAK